MMVSWAQGLGANLAKAKNKKGSWRQLRALMSKVLRTGENYKSYMALHRDDQLSLKSVNGWISGAQCEGEWRNLKNVLPRDLMTLDLDYPDPEFYDQYELGLTPVSQYEGLILSTRSHHPDAQRYRMILPLKRMVTPEEYGPLVRIFSFLLDNQKSPIKQVDKVSARRAQMMFLPTASRDGEFKVFHNQGELVDPDIIFGWFEENVGDWKDLSKLPLFDGEEKLRQSADKAEDPWLKQGPVGYWCRAYTIQEAIEKFLSDVYVPGDSHSGKPRYTYTGGSASNGAVVEDDGRFLYSHHGTDPVGEQLVNAWDLIRIHLFGKEDESKNLTDVPMGKRPSWKSMMEFVKTDERYLKEQAQAKYDQAAMFDDSDIANADEDLDEEHDLSGGAREESGTDANESTSASDDDFSDADVAGGSDDDIQADIDDLVGGGASTSSGSASAGSSTKSKKRQRPQNPDAKTWFAAELDIDNNGNIKSNVHNTAAIIFNDARFYGAIRFDDFTKVPRVFHPIQSKTKNVPTMSVVDLENGDRWTQDGHVTLRAILATPNGPGKVGYGLGNVAERDIQDGVMIASRRNRYHPVKEFLESEEWDGVERIDTLFIDYLGVPDTAYAREAASMVMIASVARIYEPGHKFDYAVVLEGKQGIQKSTFIKKLYGDRWFGEINFKLNETQKIAEHIGGKWCMELPELAAYYKSDHNDAKLFLSASEDTVRMAYAREVSEFPRQTVFWGTTNDKIYLKDPTGNRRWWIQIVEAAYIDVATLLANRTQLWAEARARYLAMREKHPKRLGDLPLTLQTAEAIEEAKRLQEGAREVGLLDDWTQSIEDWVDEPVRLSELIREYNFDIPFEDETTTNLDHIWVRRNVFRASDACIRALGQDYPMVNAMASTNLNKAIAHMREWRTSEDRYRRWGTTTATWRHRKGVSQEDLERGFTVVPAPTDTKSRAEDWFTDEDVRDTAEAFEDLI